MAVAAGTGKARPGGGSRLKVVERPAAVPPVRRAGPQAPRGRETLLTTVEGPRRYDRRMSATAGEIGQQLEEIGAQLAWVRDYL